MFEYIYMLLAHVCYYWHIFEIFCLYLTMFPRKTMFMCSCSLYNIIIFLVLRIPSLLP